MTTTYATMAALLPGFLPLGDPPANAGLDWLTKLPPYRVLITGSRSWPLDDRDQIAFVLRDALTPTIRMHGVRRVRIVHGDCPTGVDRYVRNFVHYGRFGKYPKDWLDDEPHPADWDTHGRAAGYKRNQEMVDTGPDVCFAFIQNDSRGTMHCLTRAIRAGIATHIYPHGWWMR